MVFAHPESLKNLEGLSPCGLISAVPVDKVFVTLCSNPESAVKLLNRALCTIPVRQENLANTTKGPVFLLDSASVGFFAGIKKLSPGTGKRYAQRRSDCAVLSFVSCLGIHAQPTVLAALKDALMSPRCFTATPLFSGSGHAKTGPSKGQVAQPASKRALEKQGEFDTAWDARGDHGRLVGRVRKREPEAVPRQSGQTPGEDVSGSQPIDSVADALELALTGVGAYGLMEEAVELTRRGKNSWRRPTWRI